MPPVNEEGQARFYLLVKDSRKKHVVAWRRPDEQIVVQCYLYHSADAWAQLGWRIQLVDETTFRRIFEKQQLCWNCWHHMVSSIQMSPNGAKTKKRLRDVERLLNEEV